jgi:hypothetical protein
LGKDEQAVNLSLGGPVISYSDLPIPLPFLTATYGYGLDSTLTGFGSLNITSLFYGNVLVKQTNFYKFISLIIKLSLKKSRNMEKILIEPLLINFIVRMNT